MPIASFNSVREVSSEDAVHVAENLLKENAGKKWRTKTGNEKSAYVVLEFKEPQQILGIDIGNEHSAFIEVQVSRFACQPDDFHGLLLSSSFMTPTESKSSSNQNRVRCFSGPALVQTALPEKWKLLKIVCTQPFNRHVQYGISFVKVHVAAAASSASAAPAKKSLLPEQLMQFGGFKLRQESTDSETDNPLSRFESWKKESLLKQHRARMEEKVKEPEKDNSKPHSLDRSSSNGDKSISKENKSAAKEDRPAKREEKPSAKGDKPAKRVDNHDAKQESRSIDTNNFPDNMDFLKEKKSSAKEDKAPRKEEKTSSNEDKLPKKVDKHDAKRESGSKQPVKAARVYPEPTAQKRLSSGHSSSATPAKKPKIKDPVIQYRPFHQLLKGVVLVISGIENPDRADLRSKAMALGAEYKADWKPECTHLICAFKNTPKYNRVKNSGSGKIVDPSWIKKCYELRKYLPWRRYALIPGEQEQPESDEELCDEARKPSSRRESNEMEDGDETIKVTNTYDVDPKDQKKKTDNQESSSGVDTEDELERVADENRRKKAKPRTPVKKQSEDDIYDASTDEEEFLVEKRKQIVVLD